MATSSHSSVWQLSLYEQNRKPHQVITDKTKIAISPRSLHNELMCPICLDILKKTMCTKECLHRFCQECIITALRSGNKECPTCRKKLVSKRSLRFDPNIDDLIAKIFPKRDEYEAHQEEMMLKKLQNIRQKKTQRRPGPASRRKKVKLEATESSSSSSNEDNESSSSENENEKTVNNDASQTQNFDNNNLESINSEDPPTKNKTIEKQTSSSSLSSSTTIATIIPLDPQSDIELIFKPKVITTNLDLSTSMNKERYIKTKAFATIDHLSKYLSDRIALESTKPPGSKKEAIRTKLESTRKFHIFIKPVRTGKEFVYLDGCQNLSDIYTKYWHSKRPLELYYARE